MGGLDFLKLHDKLGFASRVAIWVVLQRKRAEGFAYLILGRIRGNVQVRIVISRRISFDHGGGG